MLCYRTCSTTVGHTTTTLHLYLFFDLTVLSQLQQSTTPDVSMIAKLLFGERFIEHLKQLSTTMVENVSLIPHLQKTATIS